MIDTWRGSADFEAQFPDSGDQNVRARIAPMSLDRTRRCPECIRDDDYRPEAILSGPIENPQCMRPLIDTYAFTITPEETAKEAGIKGDDWAEYNRKFNELFRKEM